MDGEHITLCQIYTMHDYTEVFCMKPCHVSNIYHINIIWIFYIALGPNILFNIAGLILHLGRIYIQYQYGFFNIAWGFYFIISLEYSGQT